MGEQEEQYGEPVQSDIELPSAEEPQQAQLSEGDHIFQPSFPNDESHANLYERFQGPNACEVITRTFPELSSEAAAQLLCAFDGDVHAGIVAYARSKELQEQQKRAQEQARIRELQHWHEQNQQMELARWRRQQQQQQRLLQRCRMSPLGFRARPSLFAW